MLAAVNSQLRRLVSLKFSDTPSQHMRVRQRLHIRNSSLSIFDLSRIFQRMPGLTDVNVSSFCVPAAAFDELCKTAKGLRKLSVFCCAELPASRLLSALRGCSRLSKLELLVKLPEKTTDPADFVFEFSLPQVQSLDLLVWELLDVCIDALLLCMPNISALALHSQFVPVAVTRLASLTSLSLSGQNGQRVPGDFWRLDSCKRLRSLELFDVDIPNSATFVAQSVDELSLSVWPKSEAFVSFFPNVRTLRLFRAAASGRPRGQSNGQLLAKFPLATCLVVDVPNNRRPSNFPPFALFESLTRRPQLVSYLDEMKVLVDGAAQTAFHNDLERLRQAIKARPFACRFVVELKSG